jgi:succinyl-CoA--D-citramalate CoA-transferase
VVAGRIHNVAEVLEDPHVLARRAIVTLLDERLGPIRMPAPVPRLSRSPGAIRWTGRRGGADNAAVLGDIAGVGAAELQRLSDAGVI